MHKQRTPARPSGRSGRPARSQSRSGGPAKSRRRKFTRTTKSSHSVRGGHFRGGRARFAARKGRPKGAKIDISFFINKVVAATAPQKAPVIEHAFEDFRINSKLLHCIKQNGYTKPTPIQDKIIPLIIDGRDVVGLANTGTGKTAAFLIPLIQKVSQNPHKQVLIATPTRELALQIDQELRNLCKQMRMYSVVCVGGEHIGAQIRKLRNNNNFIIGTPGRLIDLVKREKLKLGGVDTVVLDEVDRMLDMGFVKDIRFLMSHIPADRQTLCFSATISTTIKALINDFLKNPSMVSVKTAITPRSIEQDIIRVRNLNKIDVLHDLLQNKEFKKVLVFGRTKRGVEKLSKTLNKRGIRVESIHSDKTQTQRKKALVSFKQNRVQTLVATDVAARGLHIDNITHVINYDIPQTHDDYIHRIGRTGRGDRQGKALTFVD